MKRIFQYLQVTKDNGLVFNPPKKMVVDFYSDADFAGLWGHENLKDPFCYRSGNWFVVTFTNFPLLWVSKLQTEIALSILHSQYLELTYMLENYFP